MNQKVLAELHKMLRAEFDKLDDKKAAPDPVFKGAKLRPPTSRRFSLSTRSSEWHSSALVDRSFASSPRELGAGRGLAGVHVDGPFRA